MTQEEILLSYSKLKSENQALKSMVESLEGDMLSLQDKMDGIEYAAERTKEENNALREGVAKLRERLGGYNLISASKVLEFIDDYFGGVKSV